MTRTKALFASTVLVVVLAVAAALLAFADVYANPTSTGEVFTPSAEGDSSMVAGGVYLHPIARCSTNPTPNLTEPDGLNVTADNVTIINPEVVGCETGITSRAKNLTLVADPNKEGYDPQNGQVRRSRWAISYEQGNLSPAIKALNGGSFFLKNDYRPITVRSCGDGTGSFAGLDISHPDTSNIWPNTPDSYRTSIVGIKFLHGYGAESVNDRSCHGYTVSNSRVAGFREEGISFDSNGGSGPAADPVVQGTTTIRAISGNAVSLAQPTDGTITNLDYAKGSWLGFNSGGAVGRFVKVASVDTATNTLTLDANPYLADARAGDSVSITAPYRDMRVENNWIDSTDSMVGADTASGGYRVVFRNNTVVGDPSRHYGQDFNLRPDPVIPGSALQSIRISSHGEMECGSITPGVPGTVSRQCVGLASYNSVTGSTLSHDLSFHLRRSSAYSGIPNYQANTTFTLRGGATSPEGQLWNDGSNALLASDPNP